MADPKTIIVPRATRGGFEFPEFIPPSPPPPPPPPPPPAGANYPRKGPVRVGLRDYALDDAEGVAERTRMALCDVVFLGLYRDGPWDNGDPSYLSRAEVVTDLKARNPNLIIADYINVMETGLNGTNGLYCQSQVGPTGNGGSWTPNDWIGRNTSGVPISTFGQSVNTNCTAYVTPDSQGRDYVDYYYQTVVRDQILAPHIGASGVGASGMNVFLDNCFHRMRTNSVDLNRDGVADGGRSNLSVPEAVAWRTGTAKTKTLAVADYPDLLFLGNVTEWFDEKISPVALPAEYVGFLHGGVVENNTINFPFTGVHPDSTINPDFGSGELGFAAYTYAMDNCISPKYVSNAFSIAIVGDPANPSAGTNWSHMRWAFTQTSLDDGYFHVETGPNYNVTVMLDEMGTVNTGTTGLAPGWLGTPIDGPQRTPLHNSLYIRRFTGGAVIHNMSRTSSVTVTVGSDIPSGYTRLNGAQDPTTNNGTPLTTFSLDPIDGLFVRL